MKTISWMKAKALGFKRYFTGEPCSKGHVAERYVSTRDCVPCCVGRRDDDYQARYRASHKDKARRYAAEYNPDYYAANAENLREYARQYRRDNVEAVREREALRNAKPERKSQKSKNNSARYQRDGARKRKLEADRYKRERERIKARVAQYRKDNPEKVRLINRVCGAAIRAVRKGAVGKYGKADVMRLFLAQKEKCVGCSPDCLRDLTGGFHVDHILALTRGGTNWPDNLQLLCQLCNLSKGTKTMEEWREWLSG